MIFWSKIRRSRGFGIHSPFAYDLVQNTLRERKGYGYYPSDPIDCHHDLRLILRLVARFQPRRVLVSGDVNDEIVKTVRRADSRIAFTGDTPDMVIISGHDISDISLLTACKTLRAGGVVLSLDRRKSTPQIKRMKDVMECGMTFFSRHKWLAVGARHLPRQDFEVSF